MALERTASGSISPSRRAVSVFRKRETWGGISGFIILTGVPAGILEALGGDGSSGRG